MPKIKVLEDVFSSNTIVEVAYELDSGVEVVGYYFVEAIGINPEMNLVTPENPIPIIEEEDITKVIFYGMKFFITNFDYICRESN